MITKAEITLVKSLGEKKARTANGLFVVEGRKMVEELVASDFLVETVYTTREQSEVVGAIKISPKEMERMSHLKTPSDYLALARIPNAKPDVKKMRNSLILALDNVQDPGNVGTIIRMADWFGIRTIVCSEDTADCFNPKVIQATMGAILRVRIHYLPLTQTLEELEMPIYGTFLEGNNIYKENLSEHGVIVMGNEGRGISSEVASLVSHKLFIPPFSEDGMGSESLNVAVATAIVCSEFRRRM